MTKKEKQLERLMFTATGILANVQNIKDNEKEVVYIKHFIADLFDIVTKLKLIR